MSPMTIVLITSTSMLAGTVITGLIGVPLHFIPVRPWSYDVAVLAGINLVLWLAAGISRKLRSSRTSTRFD